MRIPFVDPLTKKNLIMDLHRYRAWIVIHVHDEDMNMLQEVSFPRRIAWQVRRALDLLAPKKGKGGK